ncbi:MAG: ribosomal protein S18-alanine N-acetyltransferase [Sulfuriflexus sp.]|nr:ribosomal protein S18-alanine N-acetyltransferase [Sulfuriflexus sp.]
MSAVLQQPKVTVRPMRDVDVDAVLKIELDMYEFPWTEGILKDCLRVGYCCWVLCEDGGIVAYAVLSIAAGESHLLNVCVSAQCQRRGYGKQLVEHMLDLAKRHDAQVCLLEVRPSNTAAVTLYEKMNFVEVGTRPAYYPAKKGREDALILALELIF